MRSIDLIREVSTSAAGRWISILDGLGITVPNSASTHSACPACGGKDRFRFDDNGRGSHICNQCGAGDGLDLVAKVFNTDTIEAAKSVADILGIDYRTSEQEKSTSQTIKSSKAELEHRKQEQSELNANEQTKRRERFTARYKELEAKTVEGTSNYLTNKGLTGFTMPLLSDGGLLIPLVDAGGVVTGAQTIAPTGEKRLLADSIKKGSYYPVNAPESVFTVIIAEGVATALSVHLIHPDALTVAAIDAGNLIYVARNFRDQYARAKIIIAADNDIKPDEPNTGKEKAEQAAKSVAGWVALPPTEHKADWDDYRQQNGLECATDAFNASLYQCNSESPAAKPIPIVAKRDPLKPYADIRHGGLYWVEPKTDRDTGEPIERESWLCEPLTIAGIGEDDNERYLILKWTPEGGQTERTEALPMRDIGERDGWSKLRAGGLSITAKNGLRAILADYLQRNGSRDMWAIVSATGWQSGAYIMPDGSVIGSPTKPVLFHGRSAAAKGYGVKGTADSWQDNVALLAKGNPSMMLGIACAFAAPLIGLVGADGFGVHLFGGSSAGKTTTGNAATSVYGEPEGLKLTWYSTALGLVNEAAAHNDGFMPLDEIGQGSNRKAVADAAYALFNGVGKIQGAKEGGNRDVKRWRAMAFSTGEIDLESYIRADGGKVNAGQLVRLLNVPITKATEFHGYADGKAHADAMRNACQNHYGAVGREWIKYLASQKEAAAEAVRAAERRWLSLLPAEASEQVRRVSSRFAVLEAALILSRHLTGWNEQEIRDALQYSFNAWVNEFGMQNRESRLWIEQAESFLQRFGYSRYLPHPNPDPRDLPIKDLAGYRVKNRMSEEIVFHTWPAVFKDEIASGANHIAFAQVLADAGMLDKPKKGIAKKTLVIDGSQPHFIVLRYQPDTDDESEE
ncbi:DUF927 domain-containing protein [Jinshanibacter sp. LJY008]|uniref:DUF927 domain-containing protein n=1 Tax=Limnobaculum eriocheiris TaxID=2897391 RepID=A0A9X1MV66_9GAMM|nr:TOPRIM and DUF927 domain-containing protein [Limnobaculum eriocheiris]MCD1125342.1 DUF927 domain-containing protein [Limnobaculum eriocheiris]